MIGRVRSRRALREQHAPSALLGILLAILLLGHCPADPEHEQARPPSTAATAHQHSEIMVALSAGAAPHDAHAHAHGCCQAAIVGQRTGQQHRLEAHGDDAAPVVSGVVYLFPQPASARGRPPSEPGETSLTVLMVSRR
jgi:hypothetical protein